MKGEKVRLRGQLSMVWRIQSLDFYIYHISNKCIIFHSPQININAIKKLAIKSELLKLNKIITKYIKKLFQIWIALKLSTSRQCKPEYQKQFKSYCLLFFISKKFYIFPYTKWKQGQYSWKIVFYEFKVKQILNEFLKYLHPNCYLIKYLKF